ncbi:hypothetical protein [Methylorubrum sp. SB2]|uniref:hypothetical protein n=1 Tax=Methylorubrum subtropicum TaxID=3138812 RepID=UPI00313E4907
MTQDTLNARYRTFQKSLSSVDHELLDAFSPPLLLKIPDDWQQAAHRVMWIGQETADWSWEGKQLKADGVDWDYPDIMSLKDFAENEISLDALTYGYGEFEFAANHRVNRSPFWRYFRWTMDEVRKHGNVSAVWTNVVRSSANSDQGYSLWAVPDTLRAEFLARQRGLLTAEIEILQPSLIIFVSGPHYDGFIGHELDGYKSVALAPFTVRRAARLLHPVLPENTFRTYHPGFLNRNELGFSPIQAMIDQYSRT